MSNNEVDKITLIDPDSGQTLDIPAVSCNWNADDYKYDYTMQTQPGIQNNIIESGIISSENFSTIFERPRDNELRKRYTGHKKVYDVNNIGIHILEKLSKRGE